MPFTATKKRRAAAYARVSADSDEQYTSYVAQVDYYTNYIQNHNDWEFAGIYTDEGITGTSTRKRDGFNRMIADAIAGKIYRQIRMLSSSVGIPFCIFMRMDAIGRKLVHFRPKKRFAETGMKKAKESGAETAEKLDENTVL